MIEINFDKGIKHLNDISILNTIYSPPQDKNKKQQKKIAISQNQISIENKE